MSQARRKWQQKRQQHVAPPRLEIPLDEEDCRFMKSFLPSEAGSEDAVQFFDTYGFIIFRNVISSSQCQDTINDMWELLEEQGGLDRGLHRFGMPKGAHGLFRPALLRIRQGPKVHQCFASVLKKDDIIVSHDRWLLHRPTRNVDGNGMDCAEWETERNIHLDLNPWDYVDDKRGHKAVNDKLSSLRYHQSRSFTAENNLVHNSMGRSVQGIINLGDITSVSNGGTIVVPGFHCDFEEWVETDLKESGQQNRGASQFRFTGEDPLQAYARHVTLREGSLLIWDQRLAHGSTPNRCSVQRCAIPIRFFDAGIMKEQNKHAVDRSIAVRDEIKKCGFSNEVTDVGRRVFGLDMS